MNPGALVIIGIVGFVALVVVLAVWGAKKRREGIRAALGAIGLTMVDKSEIDEKSRVWSRVAVPFGKHMWRDGPKGIQWFAEGSVSGLPVVVLEHRYATGAGKSRQMHYHTTATAVGVKGLPRIFVREKHLGDKLMGLFGTESISIGDEAFEKRFRIFAEGDAAVPGAFLTPGLRAWLLEQPGHDLQLITGPEGLTTCLPKMLPKPERIATLARKPAEALAALAAAVLAASLEAGGADIASAPRSEARFGEAVSRNVR
jgi:hypothetical protein